MGGRQPATSRRWRARLNGSSLKRSKATVARPGADRLAIRVNLCVQHKCVLPSCCLSPAQNVPALSITGASKSPLPAVAYCPAACRLPTSAAETNPASDSRADYSGRRALENSSPVTLAGRTGGAHRSIAHSLITGLREVHVGKECPRRSRNATEGVSLQRGCATEVVHYSAFMPAPRMDGHFTRPPSAVAAWCWQRWESGPAALRPSSLLHAGLPSPSLPLQPPGSL
jgi:hypothetical protein